MNARHRIPAVGALLSLVLLSGCGVVTGSSTTVSSTASVARRAPTVTTADSRGSLAPAPPGGVCDPTAPGSTTPAGAATASAGSAPASETNETVPAFFSASSPWNEPVDTLPVAPNSRQLLRLASERVDATENAGERGIQTTHRMVTAGLNINTCAWTTPIVTEQGGRPTHLFCRQIQCGPDAVGLSSLPIPTDVSPDPRYDGWFTVVDSASGIAYDFWRARRQADGSISYEYVKKWKLSGPGYQAPDQVSARGSGLPLFAGEITLGDLRSGQINHALAISVPGPAQGSFVPPASATDGDGATGSLPEGARIRLDPSFQLRDFPRGENRRVADAIVAALVRYGAIVVDRSIVPTLYAQRDVSGRFLVGNEIRSIHLADFQVVALPRRYAYPPPAQTASQRATSQAVDAGGQG